VRLEYMSKIVKNKHFALDNSQSGQRSRIARPAQDNLGVLSRRCRTATVAQRRSCTRDGQVSGSDTILDTYTV
jgi:hypothetical protein